MSAAEQKGQYLSELLKGIALVTNDQNVLITGLQLDSRKINVGDCFIALTGSSVNGSDYIEPALAAGAMIVLIDEKECKQQRKQQRNIIYVGKLSERCGDIAHRFYGQPTEQMRVFGVTGTNGKTSVSYFLAKALDNINGQDCTGVIGTLGNGLVRRPDPSAMTTPDPVELHKSLAKLEDEGATSAVIEASSHGLAQDRLGGVKFDVAVFTNLTRDHLDYHGDMQSYGAAKMTLFQNPQLQGAVVNLDDPFSEKLLAAIPQGVAIMGYSLNAKQQLVGNVEPQPMITCLKLNVSLQGLQLYVETPQGSGTLTTRLLGRFNASNLLAALGALLISGTPLQQALDGLSNVSGVKGRMEAFSQEQKAVVVIDYAHTPDGLAKALETLREVCTGKLWCVFGCGGDRDKGKRPLMGAIVEELADSMVITNDNPRSEEPSLITENILTGLKAPARARVVLDRREAIELAIANAEHQDIILVAGKGHEDWQEIQGQRFAFNDRNVVLKALNEKASGGIK